MADNTKKNNNQCKSENNYGRGDDHTHGCASDPWLAARGERTAGLVEEESGKHPRTAGGELLMV